jgi:hypothetical protein
VRAIAPAELVAASIWIENWQRMLPLITATSGVRPKGLKKSLLHFVTEPMALSRIERHFSSEDPMLARSQVFDLLRIGKLASPGLHTERLSFHTLFGPA